MLLEISCSVEHFIKFLDDVEATGIRPDFDMHGADINSSFSSISEEPIGGESEGIN